MKKLAEEEEEEEEVGPPASQSVGLVGMTSDHTFVSFQVYITINYTDKSV